MKKILLGIILLSTLLLAACTTSPTGKVTDELSVRIPLADLSETVQFYEHNARGVTVRYFAVLGSDGNVRTAFDACDVCGGAKGYEQKGNDIECRNCGRVFDIDGLGTENKGYGCWPSFLPHTEQSDSIYVKIADIDGGAHRFAQ